MDMGKKVYILILLFFLHAATAYTSEWARIDLNTKSDSKQHVISLGSVEQKNGVITFLEKYIYPDGSSIQLKSSIDCVKEEFRLLEINNYGQNGEKLKVEFQLPEWAPIPQYSERHEVKHVLCIGEKPLPSEKIETLKFFRTSVLEGSYARNPGDGVE